MCVAKVRRLYDIANVLTTLGLIRKKTFLAPNHRKMPGYSWAGPTLDQIETIRKSAVVHVTQVREVCVHGLHVIFHFYHEYARTHP